MAIWDFLAHRSQYVLCAMGRERLYPTPPIPHSGKQYSIPILSSIWERIDSRRTKARSLGNGTELMILAGSVDNV